MYIIKRRNKEFQDPERGVKNKSIPIQTLLESDEIKVLIAEFIIFFRLTSLLTPYTLTAVDPVLSVKRQYMHHGKLLIEKVSNLPICKTNGWKYSAKFIMSR